MFEKTLCFCLPYLVQLAVVAGLFVLAYVIYRLLLLSLKRIKKHAMGQIILKSIQRPLLFLFLESAAFFSVSLFGLQEKIQKIVNLGLLVLIVITVGWLLIRSIRNIFHHTINAYKKDPRRKSSVVQIQFVYRLIVISIIFLTIGGLLLLFPSAKQLGVGLLGSAGIVGIVVGMAARPIFLNLMAGLQIALTKTINLEDAVVIEGDFGRVESIHLTYVIVRTWDLKRRVIPISQFIDKTFQNMDLCNKEKIGTVFLYVDYHMPVDILRKKFEEVVQSCPHFNGNSYNLHVFEMNESNMQIRLTMSGNDSASTFELRCFVREKMIDFLQKEHAYAFPVVRDIYKQEAL